MSSFAQFPYDHNNEITLQEMILHCASVTTVYKSVTTVHKSVTTQHKSVTAVHKAVPTQHKFGTAVYKAVTTQHKSATAVHKAVTTQSYLKHKKKEIKKHDAASKEITFVHVTYLPWP